MRLGEASGLRRGQLWITERYEQYVLGERDVSKERDALVTIMTRPKRNRVGSFSASSMGTCMRYRQLQYLGYPKNPEKSAKTYKIFMNGDYVHLRYQVAGLVGGWLKAAEVLCTHDPLKLVGTVDGINIEDDVVEFKSINSRGFAEVMAFGPNPKHLDQVQGYLFLTGAAQAWLLYENKDTQDTKEFQVVRSEPHIKVLMAQTIEVNQATDAQELLPMLAECEREEGKFKWCEYAASCPKATWRTPITSSSPTM